MANDDSNSMQAQLGLVGQGQGSFNPLGLATPPPQPMPLVKHPGEVSADIVRQTQTQMATTLQTTSAMRLGGMGGMAFGGGGGVGAVGAFAQQYQMNMAGITSQYMNPMSAQMMGMMSGMGGGFQNGMMPHPSMMTSPGMGIYRPFPQGPGPTVSPMPQMPMFQHPLSPMPPPPQFQTPMELANNMSIQAGQRRTAAMFATPGVIARGATEIGLGYMGAGVGAALGARFGPMGATIGGTLGHAIGAFGAEHFGLGATAQHITDRMNPFRTMAIRGQQMLSSSQNFVGGGSDLNMQTGRGLSQTGATHLGRLLEDTAYSTRFRRETGGAFSAQDLTKITNVAGQQGMLNDAQSVDQIHDRVKNVAKSLVSFMKIANEPNVVAALKSMGQMRAMGMSLGETMDAAVEARMYSKMAHTSASNLMATSGAQGAMLYQQQGLSAGLGMRMGMGAMGMASAAVGGGAFTPQRLAMLGGVHGVAQHEMESSAAMLKMPMMAAAMTRMGKGGEFIMDGQAVRSLSRGGLDINQMATRGASNMMEAVRSQGVGALGMMQVQGTEIQDNLGRLLGPQGMQAVKMQQVMQTMKLMGLAKNPGGFATAGLSMGMSNDQVKSLMSQANSPGYFQDIQRQLSVQQMEVRAAGNTEYEKSRRSLGERAVEGLGGFHSIRDAYTGIKNIGEDLTNMWSRREQSALARERGQVPLYTERSIMGSDTQLRNIHAMSDPAGAAASLRSLSRSPSTTEKLRSGWRSLTDPLTGGDIDNRRQTRAMDGGLGGLFSGAWGSALETTMRVAEIGLTGRSSFADAHELAARRASLGDTSVWTTAQGEGAESRVGRIAELSKIKGADESKIRKVIGEVQRSIATDADAKQGVLLAGGLANVTAAIAVAQKAAGKLGFKLTPQQASSVVAASGKLAGTLTKNDRAIQGFDVTDARADRVFKEALVSDQNALSGALYGKSFGGSTQDEQARLTDKLFGSQPNAKAGTLAALMTVARRDGVNSPAGAYALKALSEETDEYAKDEAKRLVDNFSDSERRQAGTLGEKQFRLGKSYKDTLSGMEGVRAQSLVPHRALLERSGRMFNFGATEGGKNTSTAALLGDNKNTNLSDAMKDIRKRFVLAKGKGASTKDIEAEADELVLDTGVTQEFETGGGRMEPSEEQVKKLRADQAATAKDVSAAFPQAVTTFSEASRAMLRAAELLGRGRNRPDMQNGGTYSGME